MGRLSEYLESVDKEGIEGGPVRVYARPFEGFLVIKVNGVSKEAVDVVVERLAQFEELAGIVPERGLYPPRQTALVSAGKEPDWKWTIPMRRHAAIYRLKGNYHPPAEHFIPGLPILAKDLI